MLTTAKCQTPSSKCILQMHPESDRDWWRDFAFLWMGPVCLGKFFLSRTGLKSFGTSCCLLDLSFHRVNLIWVWPSIQTRSLLPWCKTGGDGLQCEWSWLCSLRTKHLELTGSSSWTPLACTCCLQKRPQLRGMHQREKICMAREAVRCSTSQLGSASAVGPTADWYLLVVVWPKFELMFMNAMCEMTAKPQVSRSVRTVTS